MSQTFFPSVRPLPRYTVYYSAFRSQSFPALPPPRKGGAGPARRRGVSLHPREGKRLCQPNLGVAVTSTQSFESFVPPPPLTLSKKDEATPPPKRPQFGGGGRKKTKTEQLLLFLSLSSFWPFKGARKRGGGGGTGDDGTAGKKDRRSNKHSVPERHSLPRSPFSSSLFRGTKPEGEGEEGHKMRFLRGLRGREGGRQWRRHKFLLLFLP